MERTGSSLSRILFALIGILCVFVLLPAVAFAQSDGDAASADSAAVSEDNDVASADNDAASANNAEDAASVEDDLTDSVDLTTQADFDLEKVKVAYVDAKGNDMGTRLCGQLPSGKSVKLGDGWYAVTRDTHIDFPKSLCIEGNVNLILCDGTTLQTDTTIIVPGGRSLTIWGQKEGTGKLIAQGDIDSAGIGSYFNEADKHDDNKYKKRGCGEITINGGDITATAGEYYGAGIGGAKTHAGYVTINGGTVHATGGKFASGIGNGNGASIQGRITINGGFVEANGGMNGSGTLSGIARDGGAGIGSANNNSKGAEVTITGGTVRATGGGGAAGIGGSLKSNNDSITIAGGDVVATAGEGASGIGCGAENDKKKTATITLSYETANPTTRVFATSYKGEVQVERDFVDEADGTSLVAKGTYKDPANLADKTLVPFGAHRIYVDAGNGGTVVADRSVVAAGNLVVVKATPNEGYKLNKLEVLRYYADADAATISVSDIEKPVAEVSPGDVEGTYSFTAPDYDVLVKATWVDTTYYIERTWSGSELVDKRVDAPEDAQSWLELTADGKAAYTIPSGTYFVDEDTVVDKGLRIKEDVTIIIPDGVSIDVLGNVSLYPGGTLTLYGQVLSTGLLNVKGPEDWTVGRTFLLLGGTLVFNGATLNATGGMYASPSLMYGFKVVQDGETALVDDREATCDEDAELLTITKCLHGNGVVFHEENGKKIGVCKYCNTTIDGGLGDSGFRIETLDGAPKIDSNNMEEVTSTLLTREEYDEGYYILLLSSPYDANDVPADDKAALEAKAKELGASIGTWFDISLSKRNEGDGSVNVQLHETEKPVHLSVEVPEQLRKDGRTFYLIRFHNGEAVVIAQGDGNVLEGESDRFSTYALAYKDGTGSGSSATKDTKANAKSTPKTGDDPSVILALVAIAVIAGIGVLVSFRKLSSK